MSAKNILVCMWVMDGMKIYDPLGVHLGYIDGLVLDPDSGRIKYAIVWFASECKKLPLPWKLLPYSPDIGGFRTFVTKVQLQGAPQLDEENLFTPDWERKLEKHYGASCDEPR